MNAPQLEFAFEITIEVAAGALQELGHTGKGMRRIVPILGGRFEGPSIRGKVLTGGYDWQLGRTDNITEIDARYLLQADDGALITIVNTGLRYGPAEVMQKIAKGEEAVPDTYYFRTIPVFETAAPQYAWCREHVFIANGIRKPAEVKIQVWKVL